MRFEKYFKEWLKERVQEETGLPVSATNDVMFKVADELNKSAKTDRIVMIVRGGAAIRSNIPSFDQNTATMLVQMTFFDINKEKILTALQKISAEQNAQLFQTEVDGKQILFRPVFETPTVAGTSFEMRRGNGNAKASGIFWQITVSYGQNAYVETPTPEIFVYSNGAPTGESYPIKGIARLEKASAPSYGAYQAQGYITPQRFVQSKVQSYVFTLYRMSNDALHKEIEKELAGAISIFSDPEKQLRIAVNFNNATHHIALQEFDVSSTYENNTEAYSLSLRW